MPARKFDLASRLHEALAREAESVVRCLFYARRADIEGRADIASVLRSIADGEISQAFGHLELLEESGDPLAVGTDAAADLASVIDSEGLAVARYTELAEGARSAGHGEAADWFDSLVEAESVHLGVLRRASAVDA